MDHIPVFEAQHLSVAFPSSASFAPHTPKLAINDLSLRIFAGEIVAIVGASGSGKSLLAHAALGILPHSALNSGDLFYQGQPLTQSRLEGLRGREIVLVPQNVSSLDPLMQVGAQIRGTASGRAAKKRTLEILHRYGMDAQTQFLYPFELSGGMARRVLISTALMQTPRLIIADEPTPGLHISAARRVLGHFRELAEENAAVLLITHDLELAVEIADRIVVLYAGEAIEEAMASDFAAESRLRHPYTKAIWRAMPQNGFFPAAWINSYVAPPPGCSFRKTCPWSRNACAQPIAYREKNSGYVRCIGEASL